MMNQQPGKSKMDKLPSPKDDSGGKKGLEEDSDQQTSAWTFAVAVEAPPDLKSKRHVSQRSVFSVDVGFPDLHNEPSYHGLLPREDIELLLQKNGDYLLRRSNDSDRSQRSMMKVILSLKWNNKCHHILVRRSPQGFWYLDLKHPFENISELLKFYKDKKMTVITNEGARLKHPLARQEWELAHGAITIGTQLGDGAFGKVFKGEMQISAKRKMPVAVRTLNDAVAARNDRQLFVKEARIMRKLRHKHIVGLYGVCAQDLPMMIIMELAGNGSLHARLKESGHVISLYEHVRYGVDASKGMRFLESNKIIHRDVSARNCLIGDKDEIKVADFGLGMLSAADQGAGSGIKLVPTKWLAPETLSSSKFTLKTDAWSFGILLWEVFSDGAEPYPRLSDAQMREAVTKKKYRLEPPYGTPLMVRELINELWDETPDERPDFRQVSKHLTIQLNALKDAGCS